ATKFVSLLYTHGQSRSQQQHSNQVNLFYVVLCSAMIDIGWQVKVQ
ncbi:MAG: hypothetical protein ACI90V_002350, partial [Bacillariaceae sp.]